MLAKLCSCVPSIDESMGNQKTLSDISDEEFADAWQERPSKWYHRVFQVICFFVFLGPIRFVIGLLVFALCSVVALLIRYLVHALHLPIDTGKMLCFNIMRLGARFLFLAFGHVWISVRGKIDEDNVRIIIANHTALIDPFVVAWIRHFTCAMKAELGEYRALRLLLECVDPIYIDRSKSTGASKQIIEHADNFNKPPVLIYPEATLNNGDVILKFHRGAFLTPYKVQPMCIRYWQPLVPKGWNTYAWTTPNIGKYLWGLVSMPFSVITVDLLPSICMEVEGKGDIDTFTEKAQLIMANHMKVKAVTRSSDEIFRHIRPKQAKPKQE